MKQIAETKCTCKSCGNIWHYGKTEQLQNVGNALQELGKAGMCCTCGAPAVLIPSKKVIDFNKCPKCGSKAVTQKQVVHEIE